MRLPWVPVLALLLALAAPALAESLPTPRNVSVQPAPGVEGQTTLVLQWEPVPGAFGYEVWVWQDGQWRLDEEDTSLIPVTASTRVSGLKPDTPYEFRVKATAGGGTASELSEPVGGRTLALGAGVAAPVPPRPAASPVRSTGAEASGPPPEAPSGTLGIFPDAYSVQLAWRKVAGAAYYRIEEEKDGRWIELAGPSGQPRENRVTLPGHPRPGPFRFRVFAVGANGRMSEPSMSITVSRD